MISSEILIGWGATGVVIIGHIFVNNYRLGKTEEDLKDIWRWKNSHEKDSLDTREKYQAQISELKGSSLVINEQFKQILSILSEIKDRLSILENSKRQQ